MPPQSISEEELDALPELSDDELEALPVIDETATSEDTLTDGGTGLGLGTITRGLSRIPKVGMERLRGFASMFADPAAAVSNLLAVGGEGKDVIDTGPVQLPFPINAVVPVANAILKRPAVTQTVGGVTGALAGIPLGAPGIVAGGTAGAEAANQLNQLLGTSPDTPIGEDLEKAIAGGALDAVGGAVLGGANKAAAIPTRRAAWRAERPGDTLSAKVGTPKGTTGQHTILSETMKDHADKIIELNPFKGIDPAAPNALSTVLENTARIKNRLNAEKAAALAKMDNSLAGPMVRVGPDDVDSVVDAMRSEGINVTDGAIQFAKDKLINELGSSPLAKMQYEAATAPANSKFQPFRTKREFADATEINSSTSRDYKNLSPSEAQEYIRRNIDDELNKLKAFDTSRGATELVDPGVIAARQAEESGLKLLRRLMDEQIEIFVPEARELNRGISAMIDLEDQIRMGSAGVTGTEVVMPGQGVPAALQAAQPGFIRRALGSMLPDRITNRLATDRKTGQAMNMQQQMIRPVQEMIARRTGQLSGLDRALMAPDNISKLLGGDFAAGMMAIQLIPRSAEALQQDPQQAARVLSNEAYKQALKMTGSEEAAASVAQRAGADAMKAASSGSPEEMKAFIGAASKALPGAFQPGEYPDEVDGTVYDPRSKMQMEDNAKLHLSQGTVDSIAYAKQKQEAWRNGPSKIVIHKDGQISPDLVPPPQEVPVDDAAIFADSNQTNY